MRLVIDGTTPSAKNQKRIVRGKNGNPLIIASKNYLEWEESAVLQLRQQFSGYRVKDYPIKIELTFYFPSQHRKDLDNSCSSVMDALVKAKVIEDDDWKHVDNLKVVFGGLDKDHPRCEIFLED